MDAYMLRKRLIDSGLAEPESIRGCSYSDLTQIAHVAQRQLPSAYIEFMLGFGMGAGRFLRDVDIFFPSVLGLKPIAEDILSDYEDHELTLPTNAFVFAVRNKEQFMFFYYENDNPPVNFYMSGDKKFSTLTATFWDFIANELGQCEQNYRQVKNSPYDLRS